MKTAGTNFAIAIHLGDKTEYLCWNKETTALLDNAIKYETRQDAEQALTEVPEISEDARIFKVEYSIYEFEVDNHN